MSHRHNMNCAGAFRKARSGGPRGAVMIVTLWIVLGISALVLIFARSVAVELFASANQVAALEADAVAKGALQYVIAQLDNSDGAIPDPTTFPCQAVSIGAGYFWILRPPGDTETGYCFGLVDEASKLNINSATADMLMNLPNMTLDIANSIVNWRSAESAASSEGASDSYYLSLPQPYNCKHSPFETVEELLLVQGVTPQLLYGDDTNRNGILDPNEFNTELGVTGSSVSTGTAVDGGWNNDVTVYSSQPATTTGAASRTGAGTAGTGSGARTGAGTAAAGAGARTGAGTGASAGAGASTGTRTGAGTAATTVSGGLINVNTAQTPVLLCLPGLEQADVSTLINYRNATGADLSTITWVTTAIGRTKAAALASVITVQSFQYAADIVAVSGDGRAFRRYRAIVDATTSPPQVLYWKDLTYLGWPLDPTILTSLRSGTGLTSGTASATGGGL
jgi:type II secretory pathway component PulK